MKYTNNPERFSDLLFFNTQNDCEVGQRSEGTLGRQARKLGHIGDNSIEINIKKLND